MSSTCHVCHRLNPVAARYCYYDGVALAGAPAGGPIAAGSRPFMTPFVFPSGRACKNFDELVRGCETDWEHARDMLRQGYFEGFLGGLGRADLAQVARRAEQDPDADQALDEFLSTLPGERTPPRLHASPRDVNLGQIDAGRAVAFPVVIANEGGGLLAGTARSEVPWLTLGEAPGVAEKHFSCRGEFALAVQLKPAALRAGPKPQEGKIVLKGGDQSVVIMVKASRPVVPFAQGVLAGATTPRRLAELAMKAPREAALLFESGAVPKWYEANGWTYPVVGPAASGKAAVQQYFEALGLTKPPKVRITESQVEITGAPGGSVERFVFVETTENKPVYARGSSETDWLEVGRTKHEGASARVHLRVPRVPSMPGQTLTGRAVVFANGNQRFEVVVRLKVQATSAAVSQPPPVRRPGSREDFQAVEPLVEVLEAVPAYSVKAVPVVEEEPERWEVIPVEEVQEAPAPFDFAAPAPPGPPPPPIARIPRRPSRVLTHLIGPAIIALVLLAAVVHDLLLTAAPTVDDVTDPTPLVELRFHSGENPGKKEKFTPRTMTFGLHLLDPADNKKAGKMLTFDELGRTNNVCVRIDDLKQEYIVGQPSLVRRDVEGPGQTQEKVGGWLEMKTPLGKDKAGHEREGARSVWVIKGLPNNPLNVEVTQTVELVPGEQSARYDTALVRYTLLNRDKQEHRVGIRFLLDTFIGNNDGVPFTIPGENGLCSTKRLFSGAGVPDYIQALEKDSLKNPGTVAHLQFRVSGALEAPTRVQLGGYPDYPLHNIHPTAFTEKTFWDVPHFNIAEIVERRNELAERNKPADSAVTMYWDPKPLAPNEKREVGFSYGLGEVVSDDKLLLTLGGRTMRDGEFTLTALRSEPEKGEKLTLVLPAGVELVRGEATQDVPAVERDSKRQISTVTWKLRGKAVGKFVLTVESSAGFRQKQTLRVHAPRAGVLD